MVNCISAVFCCCCCCSRYRKYVRPADRVTFTKSDAIAYQFDANENGEKWYLSMFDYQFQLKQRNAMPNCYAHSEQIGNWYLHFWAVLKGLRREGKRRRKWATENCQQFVVFFITFFWDDTVIYTRTGLFCYLFTTLWLYDYDSNTIVSWALKNLKLQALRMRSRGM